MSVPREVRFLSAQLDHAGRAIVPAIRTEPPPLPAWSVSFNFTRSLAQR